MSVVWSSRRGIDARNLYKKLGYRVAGASERRRWRWWTGELSDTAQTLIMRKSLTNPVENIDVATVGAVLALLAFLKVQQDATLGALLISAQPLL